MKVIAVAVLITGMALGFVGGFYACRASQERALQEAAQKQAQVRSEVRTGSIVSVGADSVAVRVERGAADVGKVLTLRATPGTTLLVGAAVLNRPGTTTDLTRYYRPGDVVDILTRDGSTLVTIYRGLRQGEAPAAP